MLKTLKLACVAAVVFVPSVSAGYAQAPSATGIFTVTSTTLNDGGDVPMTHVAVASSTSRCGGKELSPSLSWSDPPALTKSIAVIMQDIDGRNGLGVDHWIAYDIPGTKGSVAEGEGNKASSAFVGGLNNRKETVYLGPCPSVGDPPHHYLIAVFALDIVPGSLLPGLSRVDLMDRIKDHVLGRTSMVVRFGR